MADIVEPVIRITYQAPLAEGKGVAFETYMPLSTPKEGLDAIVDKLRSIVDRQEAIVKVAILGKQLEAENTHLNALKADLIRVQNASVERWHNSGRKGEFRPSDAEAKNVENVRASVAGRENSIAILKKELEHYEGYLKV